MRRKDDRIIIHFDYDCFYASVFEVENPALKGLPLCVQQKQIIVTCNYEARRRGLHKLQLIRDAKRICPDAVIVLGEDLTKFRDASKALYRFLRAFSWNGRVETLGFDEVFLDATDIVDYNVSLLNHADIAQSFFCLRRDDPTDGFAYDASVLAGHAYGNNNGSTSSGEDSHSLLLRLILGSHLALYMRKHMEQHMGYTATVGISTSKLLAKLVGNVNKPNGQTTLLPPYDTDSSSKSSNVAQFMDTHDVGKVPDIGFKMSHKLREFALKKLGKLDADPMRVEYDFKTQVTVGELRTLHGVDARVLEEVLAGPGMQRGIGFRTWSLLHGIDDTEVSLAKDTPKQISIEDSYLRLDNMDDALREMLALSTSLIRRMRTDLTEEVSEAADEHSLASQSRRWLAHPKTLRLSTRPRPPPDAAGKRGRATARISRSTDLPTFVFSFAEPAEVLAQRLVQERVLSLFRQLHPEKHGWDLSLLNVAVTNMVETAGTSKQAIGRDIGRMFKTQGQSLQPWKVDDVDVPPSQSSTDKLSDVKSSSMSPTGHPLPRSGSEDIMPLSQASHVSDGDNLWCDSDDEDVPGTVVCPLCSASMPDFAISAHLRFHEASD